MKIAFSTLGCPRWTWEEMVAVATDLGFDGIELRGVGQELYVPKAKCFQEPYLDKNLSRLKELGLEIPCLTSSCYLFDRPNRDQYLKEGKEYIDLASKLGAKYVRVLGDRGPQPREEIDPGLVAENLLTLAEHATDKNVMVLIETNGYFADSKKILSLIEKVNHAHVGLLWDLHHPFRFMNEPAPVTYERLKEHIRYIHLKDSLMEEGEVRYKMLGYGDVPVEETLGLLKEDGYRGYISLEWVKRWYRDLEEPGVVFSHFLHYVRDRISRCS